MVDKDLLEACLKAEKLVAATPPAERFDRMVANGLITVDGEMMSMGPKEFKDLKDIVFNAIIGRCGETDMETIIYLVKTKNYSPSDIKSAVLALKAGGKVSITEKIRLK